MAVLPLSNLKVQYTRSPYTFSPIKMKDISLNPTKFDESRDNLNSINEHRFHRLILAYNQSFSDENPNKAMTALIKRISGYHNAEFQIPLALKIFNSGKECTDPEFYNALLYIIKKKPQQNLFALAHDVFSKAKENRALSRWTMIHYITIGIQESQFQFLYPIIKNSLEGVSYRIPLFIVHNYIRLADRALTSEQICVLNELFSFAIDRERAYFQREH